MSKKTEYDMKYRLEHYARIVLDLKPEMKDRWKKSADKEGKTLSQYIRD